MLCAVDCAHESHFMAAEILSVSKNVSNLIAICLDFEVKSQVTTEQKDKRHLNCCAVPPIKHGFHAVHSLSTGAENKFFHEG